MMIDPRGRTYRNVGQKTWICEMKSSGKFIIHDRAMHVIDLHPVTMEELRSSAAPQWLASARLI
jgi:hypothetical protein